MIKFVVTKFFLLSLVICYSASVLGVDVWKCENKQGQTSFQGSPCGPTDKTIFSPMPQANNANTNPNFTGERVSMNFQDVPLSRVIHLLAETSHLDYRLDPSADRRIRLQAINRPWDEVLYNLRKRYNLQLQVTDGVGYLY